MVKSKDVPVVIEALGAVTPTLEGWLQQISDIRGICPAECSYRNS